MGGRRSLRRRVFVWFGATILVTSFAVTAVLSLFTRSNESVWRGMKDFAASRFERVWDDPPARAELLLALSIQLGMSVILRDDRGAQLSETPVALECAGRPWRLVISREGRALGTAELCSRGDRWGKPWQVPLALAVAALIIWAGAGVIARRLTRPLMELSDVVRRLGDGELSARAGVSCRAPDELGFVAEAVNQMAGRIEKQLADQRELLAAVSHELRTPLSRVRLLVEMGKVEDAHGALERIDREVLEMDGLVGELLANARLEFSTLDPKVLNPVELASGALERAGLSAKAKALLTDASDGALLRGDPTLLTRALVNLLDNAERHGAGVTALRVSRDGGRLRFEVEDAGPGFPPGEEESAFAPFRRVGVDRGGLGLGLALVRRIAAAHAGRAFVAPRTRPPGATVVLELPLDREMA